MTPVEAWGLQSSLNAQVLSSACRTPCLRGETRECSWPGSTVSLPARESGTVEMGKVVWPSRRSSGCLHTGSCIYGSLVVAGLLQQKFLLGEEPPLPRVTWGCMRNGDGCPAGAGGSHESRLILMFRLDLFSVGPGKSDCACRLKIGTLVCLVTPGWRPPH